MGYITTFRGEIRIFPAIPWSQIKDSPFLPERARGDADKDIMFRVAEITRETDEGFSIVREAVALESTWEDEARGYNIVEHVQEVVDAYPAHEFLDRIDCEGELTGDMWRLQVIGRVATKVKPKIVWPEDPE